MLKNNPESFQLLLLENFFIAAAYWGISYLNWLLFRYGGVLPMPVWPAAGLALAVACSRGTGCLPGLFLGTMLANAFHLGASWNVAFCLGIVNSIGPVAASFFVRRFSSIYPPCQNLSDTFVFFLYGSVLMSLFTASGGTSVRLISGLIVPAEIPFVWGRWWIAHLSGSMMFAPIFLGCFFHYEKPVNPGGKAGYFFAAALTAGMALVFFFFLKSGNTAIQFGLPFLLVIPMAWIAARYSLSMTMNLFTFVVIIAMAGTLLGGDVLQENRIALVPLGLMGVSYSAALHILNVAACENRRSEAALAESEKFRTLLFTSSPLPVVVMESATNRFIDCNPAAVAVYGFPSRDEVIGKTPLDVSAEYQYDGTPSDKKAALYIEKALAGEVMEFEWLHRRPDGVLWDAEVHLLSFRAGNVRMMQFTLLDITGRKLAGEEKQRNETSLRSIISILQQRAETSTDFLDHALEEMIRLTGSKLGYIYHYDEESRLFTLNTWSMDVMKECSIKNPGKIYELDSTGLWGEAVRQRRPVILNDFKSMNPLRKGFPEGHAVISCFMTMPVFKAGSIVAVAGVANRPGGYDDTDVLQASLLLESIFKVLDSRQAEDELHDSEERFRTLFENMSEGVALHEVVYDTGGKPVDYRIIEVNPAYEKHTGFSMNSARGELASLLYGMGKPPYFDEYCQVASTGESFAFETLFEPLEKYFKISVFSPKPGFFATVFEDISERKRQEDELRRKNEELEQFTYTVSHDLKSPLITVKGFAGALLRDVAAGKFQRLEADLGRIADAADRMGDLLKDLLDLSRVGRIVNTPVEICMDSLVKDVLCMLNASIAARSAEIRVQPGLANIFGDRQRLGEVIQNLVENALKFADDRPVIEIGQRDYGNDRVFFVRDNGKGIDSRYHETVFGLFNKLDARTEGTGIGLAIVRRIIEFHNGRIWVESEGKGMGATFCFTVPEPSVKIGSNSDSISRSKMMASQTGITKEKTAYDFTG